MSNEDLKNSQNKAISLYESELYDEKDKNTKSDTKSFLIVHLGSELYGLNLASVKQILPKQTFSLLPNVPNYILGIINMRGTIVSLTDLSILLDLPTGGLEKRSSIVIVEHEDYTTGLLVDRSDMILEVSESEISKPISTLNTDTGSLIQGQFNSNGKTIATLDVENIFSQTSECY